MSEENEPNQSKVEVLDLNKETIQDLTEAASEGVQCGRRAGAPGESEVSCDAGCE